MPAFFPFQRTVLILLLVEETGRNQSFKMKIPLSSMPSPTLKGVSSPSKSIICTRMVPKEPTRLHPVILMRPQSVQVSVLAVRPCVTHFIMFFCCWSFFTMRRDDMGDDRTLFEIDEWPKNLGERFESMRYFHGASDTVRTVTRCFDPQCHFSCKEHHFPEAKVVMT